MAFFKKYSLLKAFIFPIVYFTGRLIDAKKINITEVFHYIGLLSIIAACVLFFEVITYTHLQTFTGYADFMYYFFDQPVSGSYDLSTTFEIESGMKRFASFFATPLDYAAATLISFSAIAALVTDKENKIRFTNFTVIAILSTLFGIIFALSRASFASYLLLIYFYSFITNKKLVLRIIHYSALLLIIFFLFITIKGDLFDFIIATFQFQSDSSIGHVVQWLNGIQSMIKHPLGIGLGESGRVSGFSGFNTGGENQFIIIGVQIGVIGLSFYLAAYASIITSAYKNIMKQKGKIRKLAIFIFLIKIGLFIPLFTAEVESYIYISYLVWFLTGIFITLVTEKGYNKSLALPLINNAISTKIQ